MQSTAWSPGRFEGRDHLDANSEPGVNRMHSSSLPAAILCRLLWLACFLCPMAQAAGQRLSVLSFNIWGGGLNQGESIAATAAAIRAADADLVGLQEVRAESDSCTGEHCPPTGEAVSVALAKELGYHHYEQRQVNDALWANAVLSRYPILGASEHDLGVQVDVAGRKVVLFNIHATDYPYQPYQLLRIPYGAAPFLETAEQAVQSARQARHSALELLRADLQFAEGADLVLLTGDFNEPSRHDWTARAVATGRHPVAVDWPLTRAIERLGFADAYRTAHPDEVASPGFTWSPLISEGATDDHADRIDYVFVFGPAFTVTGAKVVGEGSDRADLVVSPWPSDHRAVLAELEF